MHRNDNHNKNIEREMAKKKETNISKKGSIDRLTRLLLALCHTSFTTRSNSQTDFYFDSHFLQERNKSLMLYEMSINNLEGWHPAKLELGKPVAISYCNTSVRVLVVGGRRNAQSVSFLGGERGVAF